MAKDSWPNGVTSWNDTVKFAQLVFGKDVKCENYSERLPHPSNKSFLLFAKGACGEGTPLFQVADLVEPQLEEICSYEKHTRFNTQRPNKSQQMLGSDNSTIHYWSAQLTRAPCTCRSVFGADAHQKHVQTCSDVWTAGGRFAKLWEATLLENSKIFGKQTARPIWLDKTWQAVWNWNDHNQGHGIVLHADESETYSSLDPITSLSFGRGGVLTLSAKKSQAFKMLFQEDGDALVMAGNFQEEFWHGVPERSRWNELRTLPLYDAMQAWEKAGFDYEVQLHEMAKKGEKHVRVNCTMRWHATHWEGCPNSHVSGTQPDCTGTVRTSKIPPDNVAGNLSLAGFKRSTSTADIADDSSSVKTPRSLDSQSMELVQSLLGLLDLSGQVPMARTVIAGIPVIGSKGVHDEGLAMIEEQMLECRARLFRASQMLAEYGEKLAAKVDYKSLNAMALAARQRRIMQRHLGTFHTKTDGHWLIETDIDPNQNRLTQQGCGCYHKYLVSHQCLELALEALCPIKMAARQEIAIDLGKLPHGSFPRQLQRRQQIDKRHRRADLGLETVCIEANSVLVVKALELSYIRTPGQGKRLLSRRSVWELLLQEVPLQDIKFSLQKGIRTLLEHLRTLDVARDRCDRAEGDSASAQYDIWIWLRVV